MELTKEEEKLMHSVRSEWLNIIFSEKKKVDTKLIEDGINWMYELSGLEKPLIIKVDSPYGCQIVANILKRAKVGAKVLDEVGAKVWAKVLGEVGGEVRAKVLDEVRDEVWGEVLGEVGGEVRVKVWDEVRAKVLGEVWDEFGDEVRAKVLDEVMDQKLEYYSFASIGSIYDFGWVSFYDFFHKIGIFEHEGFEKFRLLIKSGVYDMVQMKGVCIYCIVPNSVSRNQNTQLHNIEDYAIKWNDGYGQHYINGRYLSVDMFNKVCNKDYSIDEFFAESNEDVKSAVIGLMQEKFGDQYVFHFFESRLSKVDSYVDKKDKKYLVNTVGMNVGVYELFKGEINRLNVAYVRCFCPSTDRMFFLGVDSKHTKAKDAIASLYRVPKKLRGHILYIQRQGERFSTVFDEEGTAMMKNLTKLEASDVSTITGEEYFSKMTYEY